MQPRRSPSASLWRERRLGDSRAAPPPDPSARAPRHAQAAQLAPAREVPSGRPVGLHREPGGLHVLAEGPARASHRRRNARVPRGGHEQLLVEPPLDVCCARRARRLPGRALPDRQRHRVPDPARVPRALDQRGRPPEDPGPGDLARARDARQLHREQALVFPLVVLLALVLAFPGQALAGNETWTTPTSMTKPPPGKRLNLKTVLAKGNATRTVKKMRREHPKLKQLGYLDTSTGNWLIRYVIPKKELAEVDINDATGQVTDVWTGPQVLWGMARGAPGAFGRKINAPYIWLPLCVLFIVPFLDPRRLFRLLHLDLLVMLAFGISHYYFNRANISASTPLAYPVLGYLLVRALMIGFRPRKRPGPLIPLIPLQWVGAALVFILGFRIGLNVFDSNVIDVGYAGVLGAHRISHGLSLYSWNLEWHPNTYGPINYVAYMPFEWIWPNHGRWDDLPAAHGASIFFDVMTTWGIYLLGKRLREGDAGRALGIALAYAWVAYPYSAFQLESNSNDSLIAAFVVWSLVFMRLPVVRGALIALGGAAKFVPWALVPLLATGRGERRGLNWFLFAVGFCTVVSLAILPFTGDVGLRHFWDATAGYQADRPSPFSIWGLYDGLESIRRVVEAAAVVLIVGVAVVPRRRTELQVTALAAAVLIAVELCQAHWFYLYIVWFAPPLLAALFAEYGSRSWRMPVAVPESSASISTAFSHGSSSEGSKRAGTWVRNLASACSRRTPITPPRAPVIPTSVT